MALAQDVQKLYIAYFNRPADPLGLAYWENQATLNGGSTAAIASAFSASAEYKALYDGKSSAQIVNALYLNLFGRPAEQAGLDFWVARLDNQTLNIGNIAFAILSGAQNSDRLVVENKATAAAQFTMNVNLPAEITAYSGTAAIAAARAWLATVTDTPASLSAALASVDATISSVVTLSTPAPAPAPAPAPPPPPQTLTLTAGADLLTGGAGDDLFVAGTTTLSAGDVLDGAGGFDVLSVGATGRTLVGITRTSIEEIRLVNGGTLNATPASPGTFAFGHAATTDTGNVTLAIDLSGATSFNVSGVTAGQAGTAGSGIKATYSNLGTTALNVTLTGLSETFTGTTFADVINAGAGDDTITMGADGLFVVYDTIVAAGGNDTLEIRGRLTVGATVSQNVIDLSATGDQLTKVNGVAEAVVQSGFENVSLHASRPESGTGFTITANAGGSKIAGSTEADVINGGAGDDTIFGFMNQDKINGGGGTNTLVLINKLDADTVFTAANVVSNAATIANDGDLTNVQIITLSGDRVITLTLTGQTEAFTISASTRTGTGIDTTTIVAGSGNDTITGSSYVDFITGAQGADTLTGGGGADEFNFGANGSVVGTAMDVVTDFAAGSDKLKFSTTSVLRTADSSALSTLNVNQSAGGLVTFHADSNTLSSKIAAVQADSELDVANSIAFFVDGTNTYVYFAGISSGDGDDQVVQLTGVTTLATITAGASSTIA